MNLTISKSLFENYANYYGHEDGLAQWRCLGARDKCSNIVKLCAGFEHDRILEIGCGEGAILQRLSALGFGVRYAGLEVSPSAVACAVQKRIPNSEFRLFDGYESPFSQGEFDLAILSHVLEHVEHPRILIQEASRVARHVFIEVPLEDTWRLSADFSFDPVGHINFYSRKTIRRLVQSCGMQIVGASTSHVSLPSYLYRKGRFFGTLTYWIKEAGLRICPAAAAASLVYHYALTCRSSPEQPSGFSGRPGLERK